MKKLLKDESRIYRQPPHELEARILLASRVAARMNRGSGRSRFNWFVAAGAAAALAVGSILLVPTERGAHAGTPRRGLPATATAARESSAADPVAALTDWSRLDQESFNLSCQLNSERDELTDLSQDFYVI